MKNIQINLQEVDKKDIQGIIGLVKDTNGDFHEVAIIRPRLCNNDKEVIILK